MSNETKNLVTIPLEVLKDFQWMARRYADNRATYVTSLYNDHVKTLIKLGITLEDNTKETLWARDRDGRDYDHLTNEQAEEAKTNSPDVDCSYIVTDNNEDNPYTVMENAPPHNKIIKNKAKCLGCGEVLESTSRHDFKMCNCNNQLHVDGGLNYIKRGAVDINLVVEMSEFEDDNK